MLRMSCAICNSVPWRQIFWSPKVATRWCDLIFYGADSKQRINLPIDLYTFCYCTLAMRTHVKAPRYLFWPGSKTTLGRGQFLYGFVGFMIPTKP